MCSEINGGFTNAGWASSQDSFFQPYLPLQQIDMLTAKSWLVGTTNSIVTQQRDCQWDLLINVGSLAG